LKYTKSGFYSNDSLNNDLNSEFKKDSWDALRDIINLNSWI
jgi:hypothetical protein